MRSIGSAPTATPDRGAMNAHLEGGLFSEQQKMSNDSAVQSAKRRCANSEHHVNEAMFFFRLFGDFHCCTGERVCACVRACVRQCACVCARVSCSTQIDDGPTMLG